MVYRVYTSFIVWRNICFVISLASMYISLGILSDKYSNKSAFIAFEYLYALVEFFQGEGGGGGLAFVCSGVDSICCIFLLYGLSIPYGYLLLLLLGRVPRSSWLCAPWLGWGL